MTLETALFLPPSFLFFFFNFNFFFLLTFGYAGCSLLCGLSLVVASGGCSLVAMRGLFLAVASLVEHGLCRAHGLQWLWLIGSAAPLHTGS